MLDVLHFYFEDEHTYTSEEHMYSKLKLRESIYEGMYGVNFKYKAPPRKGDTGVTRYGGTPTSQDLENLEIEDDLSGLKPFNPRENQPTKPQIKATAFDPDADRPFGSILDAPLG